MPPVADYEAKNRAFLQKLQARNQLRKEQQEAKELSDADRLRRERDFNCCFSGANRRKTPPARSRRSASGGAFGHERLEDNGGWRQWEEHTVQIQGSGGEVFALRPSGERHTLARRLMADAPSDVETEGLFMRTSSGSTCRFGRTVQAVAEDCPAGAEAGYPEAPPARSPQSITQRELRALLAELEEDGPLQQDGASAAEPHAEEEGQEGGAPERGSAGPVAYCTGPLLEGGGSPPVRLPSESRPTSARSATGEGQEEQDEEEAPEARPATPTSSEVLAEAEEVLMSSPTPVGEVVMSSPTPAGEVVASSPTPEELAQRIAGLPQAWREKLLRVLQEAEASVGSEPVSCEDGRAC